MAGAEAFWSFDTFELVHLLDGAAVCNVVGLTGAFLYLMSYGAVQAGRLDGNGILFTCTNTAAAGLVLTGLMYSFNLASAVIQVAWMSIGLCRIFSGKLPVSFRRRVTKAK